MYVMVTHTRTHSHMHTHIHTCTHTYTHAHTHMQWYTCNLLTLPLLPSPSLEFLPTSFSTGGVCHRAREDAPVHQQLPQTRGGLAEGQVTAVLRHPQPAPLLHRTAHTRPAEDKGRPGTGRGEWQERTCAHTQLHIGDDWMMIG